MGVEVDYKFGIEGRESGYWWREYEGWKDDRLEGGTASEKSRRGIGETGKSMGST